MKNELTFEIEKRNLQGLFSERNFELAEQLASRMLKDYNQFDYELLLKRASIKQCLMKYDEAMQDASLAL
jgi:predicted metal-dependent hydrolase